MKNEIFHCNKLNAEAFGSQAYLYEPNDPRVKQVVDRWGNLNLVVGESDEYKLPCNNVTIAHHYIVIRAKDMAIMSLHDDSIAYWVDDSNESGDYDVSG